MRPGHLPCHLLGRSRRLWQYRLLLQLLMLLLLLLLMLLLL